MDPNQQNPQGENDPVKKLEQDLQDLTKQTPTVSPNPSDVKPVQPLSPIPSEPSVVPEIQPTQTPPQMPEESPLSQPSSMTAAAPITPVESSGSTHEIPKKRSPILMIAIILAVLALLALVAYVFGAKLLSPKATPTPTPVTVVTPSPTPDETVNWKTYTNTLYGYSLKYPSNWRAEALAAGAQGKEALPNSTGINIIENDSNNVYPDITIQVFDLEPSYLEEGTKAAVIIDNITFTKRETKQETNLYTETYTAKVLSGKFIEILFSFDPAEQTTVIFNKILSTLKFTEATTSVVPADLADVVKQQAASQSNPKVTIDKVIIGQSQVEGNYASIAYNYVDGGGAIFWLTKTEGIWKIVTGGQELPKCSLLKSYNFPSDFSCNP